MDSTTQQCTPDAERKSVSPFMAFLADVGGRIVLTIVFATVIYEILGVAVSTDNDVIVLIVTAVCGFFGWKSLNMITPSLFVWMPLGSWVIYFIVSEM